MDAYRSGRLTVRRNLHVGVGFLAATSGATESRAPAVPDGRHPSRRVPVDLGGGNGAAVVALPGGGGTKGSFLPTVAALADWFRVIAVDLPGFGDSDKPIGACLRRELLRRRRHRTCSTRSNSSEST